MDKARNPLLHIPLQVTGALGLGGPEELIKLMVDAAWGDSLGPSLSGEGWRAGLSRWAWAMRDALRRHPWAAHIPISGLPIMPREIAGSRTRWPAWPAPA